jgi:hypothetical protein
MLYFEQWRCRMMKLDEFIAETINQIVDGVVASQEHAKKKGAYVNAPLTFDGGVYHLSSASITEPQKIEFDIAVTTEESTDAKIGVGIFVAGLGIGSQAKTGSGGMEVSRIRFTIPLILPRQYYQQQ